MRQRNKEIVVLLRNNSVVHAIRLEQKRAINLVQGPLWEGRV